MSEVSRASGDSAEMPIDPLLGRTLAGKFAIEQRLGAGAMGVVYRARQVALDKTVAIKVLRQERSLDATFAERFAREARAASRLDHPNSIRVFDFGVEPDGVVYIAMEYLEGRDLFALIAEHGPLPSTRIVEILSQTLAALAVAHDMGVLHRDLKPENIMILSGRDDEGRPIDVVKVCDFGIAKIVEGPREFSSEASRKASTVGVVVGTPEYMSPEQARGEKLDARGDLYSVGVVLYHMLTGRVPFDAETPLGIVLKQVADDPAAPSSVVAGVHPHLEAICLKALRKKASERYQDAREMRLALRTAIGVTMRGTSSEPRVDSSCPPRILADTQPLPGSRQEQPTLAGVTPSRATARPPRSGVWLALGALVAVGALALALGRAHVAAPSSLSTPEPMRSPQKADPSPRVSSPPAAIPTTLGAEPTPMSALAVEAQSASARPASPGRLHRAKGNLAAQLVPPPPTDSATTAVASPPLESVLGGPASPPTAPPVSVAAPAAPESIPIPQIASMPSSPLPDAPRFDPTSAHVDLGAASHVVGATALSVNRALSGATSQLTACYRAALPKAVGPVDGTAMLHVETDGAGVITDAQLSTALGTRFAQCAAMAVTGRRISNVDTGNARADIPVVLRPH